MIVFGFTPVSAPRNHSLLYPYVSFRATPSHWRNSTSPNVVKDGKPRNDCQTCSAPGHGGYRNCDHRKRAVLYPRFVRSESLQMSFSMPLLHILAHSIAAHETAQGGMVEIRSDIALNHRTDGSVRSPRESTPHLFDSTPQPTHRSAGHLSETEIPQSLENVFYLIRHRARAFAWRRHGFLHGGLLSHQ